VVLIALSVSVISPRGWLRIGRRASVARWCACFLIALVLCPFTAPYASYDPNAAPIDLQDGSAVAAHDKDVSVAAAPLDLSCFAALTEVDTTLSGVVPVGIRPLRFIVLRI
jgi:hypothetical protein